MLKFTRDAGVCIRLVLLSLLIHQIKKLCLIKDGIQFRVLQKDFTSWHKFFMFVMDV